ncbi:beta-galactosidase [Mangrovimicrobium sediminis]|uniref:Beta-galactosidase n=1 Tax=Mangrovimicrobium sediminis TaxID=2562682 RepID=A0A4Z0LWR3_9GAMM|nr:glycoside hydrolase family 2 TIM barrel-domain containing protein [Haliea sp. SAOS-164]TGD71731.1 beta-galactosidase [Haliea sp. SAOS-164]
MKPLLLTCALCAVFSVLASCASHGDPGGATAASMFDGPRTALHLRQGWRFRFGDAPEEVTREVFDDSAWRQVSVPHTWNRVGTYGLQEAPGNDGRRGVGWYRLHFAAPQPASGQRHFLQFDAVATIAEVWLNGVRVGGHRGAFARFRLDVTEALRPGDNLLVVKADNSAPAPGSSTEHVLPLGGDYFLFGGLYREVSLVSAASAQIDLLDHGGPGIYIHTPQVSRERASVAVLARLRNFGESARDLTLVTTVHDAGGAAVATDTAPVDLAAAATTEVQRMLAIAQPRLWDGRADPYLYRVAVELREGSRVIDRVEQPLGVRTFAFDPDRGFILNDKPLRLRGASRHQDREGKGWALSAADHAEDMATMAEMGVNSVRQAHYQHAQAWTEAADRSGMVVWAELPWTHETSVRHAALPATELEENAKAQLVELIRQNYNHPSIAIWAMGNEVDVGNLVQVRRNRGKGELSRPRALLESLSALAKSEDPSGRVTAYADCCDGAAISVPGMQDLVGATDITAFNRYFGWYYGTPEDMGTALDTMHARYPQQPVGVSEYGAGGAFTQHTDNPAAAAPNPQGRPHPMEYQSWYHEENWRELRSRDYLFGTWIWNMFDFAAGSESVKRAEGDTVNINDKGLVHRDHKQRKDAFYFYKAVWSDEPVLHLTSASYTDRPYPVVDVRAYSNARLASLEVNGRALGEAACAEGVCLWRGVHLDAGANRVDVSATIDGQVLSDTATWNAPDAGAGLRILAGTLEGAVAEDGRRFGSDNFFVGGRSSPVVPFLIFDRQPQVVAGTALQALYQAYREGPFRYELPLPDGQWTVTLHMLEPSADQAASRRFDVLANGAAVLRDYSPADAAGGVFAAATASFPVTVEGGQLVLDFVAGAGEPIVSAIVVER